MNIELINQSEISSGFCENIDISKFSHWPIEVNKLKYSNFVLQNSVKNTHQKVFACYNDGKLNGVVFFNLLEYDSNLFGHKCGIVNNIIIDSNLEDEVRKDVTKNLFDKLQKYRQSENITFCSISVNSWDNTLSDTIQGFGFKYILTWADCFYPKLSKKALISSEYEIKEVNDKKDLPYLLDMTKDYFKGGRFFLDKNFSYEKVQKMYFDLVENSFYDKNVKLIGLYKNNILIGCFICNKEIVYPFERDFKVQPLRFLVFNKNESVKGLSTNFFIETSNLLTSKSDIVASGIEVHNLASLKIHFDSGYKFNNVHSVYHSWI